MLKFCCVSTVLWYSGALRSRSMSSCTVPPCKRRSTSLKTSVAAAGPERQPSEALELQEEELGGGFVTG